MTDASDTVTTHVQRIYTFLLGSVTERLSMLSQSSLTKERRKQDRVLRSIESGLKVTAAPIVLGSQVDIVKRVHVDPDNLASRKHVGHHVNQSTQATGKGLQVFLGNRVVEAFLDDVAVEHVEVVPRATADRDVVGFCDVAQERVPDVGHPGLVVVRTAGEALFKVSQGRRIGSIGKACKHRVASVELLICCPCYNLALTVLMEADDGKI